MLGYPSILSKSNNKTIMERFDITKLVNGTYELLRKQQINNKVKEDLQERYDVEKCVFVNVVSGSNHSGHQAINHPLFLANALLPLQNTKSFKPPPPFCSNPPLYEESFG